MVFNSAEIKALRWVSHDLQSQAGTRQRDYRAQGEKEREGERAKDGCGDIINLQVVVNEQMQNTYEQESVFGIHLYSYLGNLACDFSLRSDSTEDLVFRVTRFGVLALNDGSFGCSNT